MNTAVRDVFVNSFAFRHTPESPYSHYMGDWSAMCDTVKQAIGEGNYEQGYRPGVLLVNIDPKGFFTGLVQLQPNDELVGSFKARNLREKPRKQVFAARGKKIPAKSVQIVVYSSEVLAEDEDDEHDGWEIVSLNASPIETPTPITPQALIANHFHWSGGTATNMTDSEFVAALKESTEFWRDKALRR